MTVNTVLRTGHRWLPLLMFVATLATAILDTSKVYIFWNENYELSSRQLHRLVCYDWHNFTFLVHDAVYDQVMNADVDCQRKNITTSLEVETNGQTVKSPTKRIPLRPATQFFQITPLLFEDPVWRNFTEADIFIAVLYQAFLPHEHIDSMMNHIAQSSIFVIAWSQSAFFDLDKSTKAHERNFLILMSNVIPAHERPKLLELPIPIEELLEDEEDDGTGSQSELTLQLLESSLSKWTKQRKAIATSRESSQPLSHDLTQPNHAVKGNCTGPRPSVIQSTTQHTNTTYQPTLLKHTNDTPINTPYQYNLSSYPTYTYYPTYTLYQHTLLEVLTHADNPPTPIPLINTTHTTNTCYQYT